MTAITPADVVFSLADAPLHAVACTVCGDAGPHRPRLVVPALAPPHTALTLVDCVACGSGFFDPPGIRDFSDLDQDHEEFWRAYVETIGGVWETLWPVLAVQPRDGASLLDVGCGFGFTVDAWRRVRGAEAIGLELAEYGQVGARMLDIPVHRELLEDCAALTGRRFDVVYASEVVEHVPDPGAFVALLARFVADDGVLVLTTPCVDYVQRRNLAPALLACMAPGFHGFLLSPRAFARLARDVGFAHVEVRVFGERQVLWASQRPLAIDPSPAKLRPVCFEYLARRLKDLEHSSPVWQGYAFRQARDFVNLGRVGEAAAIVEELNAAIVARFGPEVLNPEVLVTKARALRSTSGFGEIAPFFLPAYWYTLGTLAEVAARDAEAARRWYRGAEALALAGAKTGMLFFLEALSLVWPARSRLASLDLRSGRYADAIEHLRTMAVEGWRPSAAHGYAVATAQAIDAEIPRACGELAALGRWDDAEQVFAAYVEGLTLRFPDYGWRSGPELASAVAAAEGSVPDDPVFPAYFSILLDVRGALPPADLSARLSAIVSLADAHPARDARGLQLEWYARAARQRFPAEAPAPAKTLYDFSFKLPAAR